MKYVKVLKFNEYSVFEVIEEYEKTIKCKMTNCENGYIIIGKNNVVKEADTIEELCDTYVFVGDDKDCYGNPLLWNIKQDITFLMKYYFNYNDIYAAIWTSKGLIYVAKIDDDGELMLI